METTNIKKFENRTKRASQLLAFIEAKEGKRNRIRKNIK
jgi:hypothetical protein